MENNQLTNVEKAFINKNFDEMANRRKEFKSKTETLLKSHGLA